MYYDKHQNNKADKKSSYTIAYMYCISKMIKLKLLI